MIDIKKIRSLFPILNTKIGGNNLVYFDNAATTHKPQIVIDKIASYYTHQNSNVHRGVHHLSRIATEELEISSREMRQVINAASNSDGVNPKEFEEKN